VIATYNNLANPNLIYPGMILKIPASSPASPGSASVPPTIPDAPSSSGKVILVSIRQQRLYVYENGKMLRTTLVSTGRPGRSTVLGTYKIYVKYLKQTMSGPGYYLPGVPYVMYFFQGYGLHGTYWHNNFGHVMSSGCVNMPTPEAQWLYNFAE